LIATAGTLRYPLAVHAADITRILAIPVKRATRTIGTYLTDPELDALLTSPDQATWTGRRDHTLIVTMAQTGLRAEGVAGLFAGPDAGPDLGPSVETPAPSGWRCRPGPGRRQPGPGCGRAVSGSPDPIMPSSRPDWPSLSLSA
jgi:hypothetical protein